LKVQYFNGYLWVTGITSGTLRRGSSPGHEALNHRHVMIPPESLITPAHIGRDRQDCKQHSRQADAGKYMLYLP